MKRFGVVASALLAGAQLVCAPGSALAQGNSATLAAGTRMYLSLDDLVTSARGGDDVGTVVRCRVWRDVENGGVVFIKAGTPATCRVEKVSRRNIGGFEGKVAVGGVETRSVDGQTVMLSGGYNKDGNGHKAVVLTVGLLLFWPALFVPGGNAELPPGTVVDVTTVNDLQLATVSVPATLRKIDLTGMANPGLAAEFMLDDFISQPKHDTFRIKVGKGGQLPAKLYVDNVNGKSVEAIPLTVSNPTVKDGQASGVAEVATKALAKYFVRGINRFEVAYDEDGQHRSTEVVMDVQM
jgi:hypothetical protein